MTENGNLRAVDNSWGDFVSSGSLKAVFHDFADIISSQHKSNNNKNVYNNYIKIEVAYPTNINLSSKKEFVFFSYCF